MLRVDQLDRALQAETPPALARAPIADFECEARPQTVAAPPAADPHASAFAARTLSAPADRSRPTSCPPSRPCDAPDPSARPHPPHPGDRECSPGARSTLAGLPGLGRDV